MECVWKDIAGYDGLYQVSSSGKVKRLSGFQSKNERVLKEINNGNGYMGVSLCKGSKPVRVYIHRLVAQAFIPNPENKPQVNHIDGNRGNNELSNIEWVTSSENHHHKYDILKRNATNKGRFGILHWSSKKVGMYFDDKLIREFNGAMEASRELGCADSTIRKVIYGQQKMHKGYTFKYL